MTVSCRGALDTQDDFLYLTDTYGFRKHEAEFTFKKVNLGVFAYNAWEDHTVRLNQFERMREIHSLVSHHSDPDCLMILSGPKLYQASLHQATNGFGTKD